MTTYLTKPSECPACLIPLDIAQDASGPGQRGPRPNDVTVCLGCGEALIFDEQMNLLKLTDEQKKEIEEQVPEMYAQLTTMQHTARTMKEYRDKLKPEGS